MRQETQHPFSFHFSIPILVQDRARSVSGAAEGGTMGSECQATNKWVTTSRSDLLYTGLFQFFHRPWLEFRDFNP
jgi:hypothetical protein